MTSRALADQSDGNLLRASVNDPDAFGVFYDRHVHGILRFLYKKTSDSNTAADLTAETFAEALRSAKRYQPDKGEPTAWLYGIAHHQLSHYLRRQQVSEKSLRKLGIPTIHLDDASLERIEASVDSTVQMNLIVQGLQTLSPTVAQAVVLRVVQDRPFAEVAKILGCTPAAARVRVSRGISQLSRNLKA